MEAFVTSLLAVALAEVGDKTQLLSFVLAARLRRPLAIILGILAATLANHALAGALGAWLATLASPRLLPWLVGAGFIACGLWLLRPDTLECAPPVPRLGAFLAATLAFFLAEMGDKTQLATVALGARFEPLAAVVLGTTLGMLAANIPAVLVGEALAHRLPLKALRYAAAALFVATGLASLLWPAAG